MIQDYLFIGMLFAVVYVITTHPKLIFVFIKYMLFYPIFIPLDIWKELKKDAKK